jgi:diamine N-acetyltransferase
MTDFTTRDATLDDIAALAALGARTFVETFGTLYQPADLEAFLAEVHSPAGVRFDMVDQAMRYRVAHADGVMIGYCKIGACTLPIAADGRKTAELKQLYVLEGWKGAGVAAALMDWAMACFAADGVDDVYLSVFSENPRAQRFYQRYGFAWHADYHFMVGQQADAEFIYKKALRP